MAYSAGPYGAERFEELLQRLAAARQAVAPSAEPGPPQPSPEASARACADALERARLRLETAKRFYARFVDPAPLRAGQPAATVRLVELLNARAELEAAEEAFERLGAKMAATIKRA